MSLYKRFCTAVLLIVMLFTCVYAEEAVSADGEDESQEALIEEVITIEEQDEGIPADVPGPLSNGDDVYLVVRREGDEAEKSQYIHFAKPMGTILCDLEDTSAVAIAPIHPCIYEYLSGEAALKRLMETDDENAVPVRDGGDGVTAWISADGETASAIITLPEVSDESWFLLSVTWPLQEQGVAERVEEFKALINEEIERLQASITMTETEAPAEPAEEERDPRGNPPGAAVAKTVAVMSVKLNKASATLKQGQQITLKATISPNNASNKKVTWSSSNKKVATVNGSGVVVAKGVGTCTITAKSNNGKKATCKITVKSKPAVTSVSIKGGWAPIVMMGKPVTLVAVCAPSGSDQAVTWSSSNTKVATVSSKGVVTPKGYGRAKITAKSKNGKTASVNVLVNKRNEISKTIEVFQIEIQVGNPVVNATRKLPIYWKDIITIYVDGLTGKIVGHDEHQESSENNIVIMIDFKLYGIKAIDEQDQFVQFRSSGMIRLGLGIGKVKGTVPTGSVTYYYKLYNTGKLEKWRK